jgi:8-amino-7-oxononanoate synthase
MEADLDAAQAAGLLRVRRIAGGASRPEMDLDGRRVVQFASNNYLGLASHPRVCGAAKSALDAWGAGAGASRLVGGGTLAVHAELEQALAAFKGVPAALVFATGSMANTGLLATLASDKDLVLLDKACHATLYDGARQSGAALRRFAHQDLARLDAELKRSATGHRRRIVVVEAVYSMDGDVAPLPALLEMAARHQALLVVDEAHSTGVLGPGGRGILEHFSLAPQPHLVLTGTLSKSLGSLGGFVAGPAALIETLVNRCRSFIYATALPGPCAAAALEALRIITQEPVHLARLRSRREALASGLQSLGWDCGPSQSPILPILTGGPAETLALEQKLWRAGYYVPAMRPPTVPAGACRLRLSVNAEHSDAHIEGVLKALGERP